MIRRSAFLVAFCLVLATTGYAQDDPVAKLPWTFGPAVGVLGSKAKIQIPKGYAFLDEAGTKSFMELNQNIPHGDQYLFAPVDLNWFAIFRFNPVGYVKDDETIEAEPVLNSAKKGTEQGNEERRKRGWSTMTVLGWRFQPQYDKQAKLLEWALLAKDDAKNEQIINYNTRILGRTGVMSVVLVADPATLDQSVSAFKSTIKGYEFSSGEKYSEFKAGDHVAEFGLAALIAGGAAAVATKKGFWAILGGLLAATWKFLAAAVVGLLAWLGKLLLTKKQ